jgi:hypothetical protein
MSPLFGWAHGRVLRRRVIERFAFRVEAVLFTLEQPLSAVISGFAKVKPIQIASATRCPNVVFT